MRTRTTIVDDLPFSVLEAGEGGRPLLLVHGFTGAKEDFADHADALAARGWWVVAPDLRGHGGSVHPADEADYSFDLFATDQIGLMHSLGWERCVLLGHSMGGMVAQVAVTKAPERFEALVLMDTSHGPLDVAEPALLDAALEVTHAGGIEAMANLLDEVESPLDTPAHQRLLVERPGYEEFNNRKLRSCAGAMYASVLVAMTSSDDRLAALDAVTCPTLVIVGEQDEPFLQPSANMTAQIKDAGLVTIPNAGHSPQFENPDAWFEALTGFLDSL